MFTFFKRNREKKFIKFKLMGSPSITPLFAHIGLGKSRVDFGDGTIVDEAPSGASVTHSYADTSDYDVCIYKREISRYTQIRFNGDNLKEADLTHFVNMQGVNDFRDNPQLALIKFPTEHNPSSPITELRCNNTELDQVVDISNLLELQGTIWFQIASKLKEFIHDTPVTASGSILFLYVYSCPEITKIDVSGLWTMRNNIQFRNNPLLTELKLPNNIGSSTGLITTFNTYQCPNLTEIDFSTLENLSGAIRIYQNTSMSSLVMPLTGGNITDFYASFNPSLTGIMDITMFSITATCFVRVNNNSNVTAILLPNTSGSGRISLFYAYSSNLTGLQDYTGTRIIGTILLNNNPNLSEVVFDPTPETTYNVNFLRLQSCGLSQSLDLSMFTRLRGEFRADNNPNLHTIINPTTTQDFTLYNISDCGYVGTIDMSTITSANFATLNISLNPQLTAFNAPNVTGRVNSFVYRDTGILGVLDLTGMSGGFRVIAGGNCPGITNIIFDPSTVWSGTGGISFNFSDNNLTGTFDLTPLTGLGGLVYTQNNPNLNQILFPVSSETMTDMRGNNCSLTSLDFTNLSGFSGRIEYQINNLVSVLFPTVTGSFSNFFFSNNSNLGYVDMTPLTGSTFASVGFGSCGMTTAEVNQMLVEFDNMNPSTVTGSRFFQIQNNSTPDSSSGGFDGLAAKSSLQSKGWTVVTD